MLTKTNPAEEDVGCFGLFALVLPLVCGVVLVSLTSDPDEETGEGRVSRGEGADSKCLCSSEAEMVPRTLGQCDAVGSERRSAAGTCGAV